MLMVFSPLDSAVSRTNEIDKITPKTREGLAERWLLLNKLMKEIELSYRAANSVDAWPFLGEQPSSEAVVEAKDWLVEVLKQAEHVSLASLPSSRDRTSC
jgi:hypothetical protein